MDDRSTTVDGTAIRWLEQDGDGTPIVLVHGIPTSPALWRHVVPRLAGRRVLAFEMTGYGDSIPEGRDRDISVAAQAERLVAWLGQLGVERAVLAGHDLGGGVVHLAALRRPTLCAGLFLTNAVGYDSWPIPSVKAMAVASPLVARLPAVALKPTLATLLLRGHDRLSVARESLGVHYRPYAEHGGGAAMARQVTALDVQDTRGVSERVRTLDVPARVVWGTGDQFQKLEYGERFARDLGVSLRRIEGGKHFTPEDHSDVIAEELIGLATEAAQPW